MASLGSLIGAKFPKGSAIDSQNRLGNLLGTDDSHRPWVVEQAANKTLSIRTIDWKFIEPHNGPKIIPWGPKIETGNHPTPQLYHMKDDAAEQHNIATQYPEKISEFTTLLRNIRNQTEQTPF